MAIRPKGNKFQVDVTVKGTRAPRVSCDTMEEAKQIEARFKAHLLEGGDPAELVTQSGVSNFDNEATLEGLLTATLRDKWQGTKSENTSLRAAQHWIRELGGDYPVAKITSAQIGAICDRWGTNGNSGGTINRKLAALSVMLKRAVEDGTIARVPRLPKRKEYEGRLRYYSEGEAVSIITFTAERGATVMAELFRLALATGMRQGELLGLTPRDIEWKTKIIMLGRTKGNARRSVPLTGEAQKVLRRLTHGLKDHEPIFPSYINVTQISRAVRQWKEHYGLPKEDELVFHSFRHTTCARLVQAGVPIVVVKEWMGHQDIATTMRYAHLAPTSLGIALDALNKLESEHKAAA